MWKNVFLILYVAAVYVCYAARNCGIPQSSSSTSKVIGGQETDPHEYPWMVFISNRIGLGNFLCGGTLIHKQWVLTTASCLLFAETNYVHLGYHNIENHEEEGTYVIEFTSKDKYIHEKWCIYTRDYDVALIKIPEPIELSNKIQLACLPTEDMIGSDPKGLPVLVTGWGMIAGNQIPFVMHEAWDVAMNYVDCDPYYSYNITSRNMCMEGNNGKQCTGDEGGPVQWMSDEGNYIQLGIVTISQKDPAGQCFFGYPTVQMYVPSFLDWIKATTGEEFP